MTPKNLQGMLGSAMMLLRAGRTREAIAAHERLLALFPGLPDSWYNLAHLQAQARLFDASLVSYQQALNHGVRCPEEVHLNRAVIFAEQLGRTDEAERELAAALTLSPDYVPALLNLGNIHEQRGDREPALNAYERVLLVDPSNAMVLSRLPNLLPVLRAGDALIERLRYAIARPGATASERADLGFGLGKALDSAGVYDEAFAAYAAANGASRQSAGPNGARYDAQAHECFVDRLILAYPAPLAPALPSSQRPPPVFICGMFRSGSSLVEQILASHSSVTTGGEIDLLPAIASEHFRTFLREPSVPEDGATLQRLRAIYLEGIAARYPNRGLLTDKRPDNFLYIGLIKSMFPDAKIVHTLRNPLDNCLSVYFLHLSHSMPYALDLLDTAHWYRQYKRLMAHWKSLYGDAIHDVDYDALVLEPRAEILRLLDYCQLPWQDTCMAFHQTRSVVMTPSAWQVREPLYTRSSGRWRHYERHLQGLLEALQRDERSMRAFDQPAGAQSVEDMTGRVVN